MDGYHLDALHFRIPFDFSAEQVDSLVKNIRATDSPNVYGTPVPREFGDVPAEWVADLHNLAKDESLWSRALENIQSWNHWTFLFRGIRTHYVIQQSPSPTAIPILLLHGAAGSFLEFIDVINRLACFPEKSDGPNFHVVVASLPGCGFSEAQRDRSDDDVASHLNALMGTLGFAQYCVHAGEGSEFIARSLGASFATGAKAVHLIHSAGQIPSSDDMTEEEQAVQSRRHRLNQQRMQDLLDMRPHAQLWRESLQESPATLLDFMGKTYYLGASPEARNQIWFKNHIIATVLLYCVTNCTMTSGLVPDYDPRLAIQDEEAETARKKILGLLAYTRLGGDAMANTPRAVERTAEALVAYRERDDIGRFASLEDPDGLADDIIYLAEFYRALLYYEGQAFV